MLDDRQTEPAPPGDRDSTSPQRRQRTPSQPARDQTPPPPEAPAETGRAKEPGKEPDSDQLKPDAKPSERDDEHQKGGGEQPNKAGEPAKPDDKSKGPDGAQARKPWRRRRLLIVVGALVLIVGAPAAYVYWDHISHFESTDDAFIAARQFAVAPEGGRLCRRRSGHRQPARQPRAR